MLYLDRVIEEHNLLQAIARVNRVGPEHKDKGFVVDYVGVGHHLKEALDNYLEREQKEIVESLSDPEQELEDLKKASQEIDDLLSRHGIQNLNDYDALFDLFYDEDTRFEYILAFRKFTRAFNLVMPRKEALDFLEEYLRFTEINVQAMQHLRDSRLSMKGIPEKLRKITDAYLESKGIQQKVAPISILDEDFLKQVEKRKRTKTKAAEIEHAIRHHIVISFDADPELYASFVEVLRQILQDFKDNWQRIYEELEKLRERIRNAEREPTYGLHRRKQMPFFRILKKEIFDTQDLTDNDIGSLVSLTQEVTGTLERELRLTGFWDNVPARNRLQGELQRSLLSEQNAKLPSMLQKWQPIIARIMELAQANNDVILYAP